MCVLIGCSLATGTKREGGRRREGRGEGRGGEGGDSNPFGHILLYSIPATPTYPPTHPYHCVLGLSIVLIIINFIIIVDDSTRTVDWIVCHSFCSAKKKTIRSFS